MVAECRVTLNEFRQVNVCATLPEEVRARMDLGRGWGSCNSIAYESDRAGSNACEDSEPKFRLWGDCYPIAPIYFCPWCGGRLVLDD